MGIGNKSLLVNFSSYTIINLINSLTPFIILPLLTKNLTSEDIGIIDLFSTSTIFLTPIIGLCIIQSISKLYFTVDNKSKYLSVLFSCIFILGGGILTITTIVLYVMDLVLIAPGKKLLILLIILYVFLTLIVEGFLMLKRNEENLKQFAFLRLSKAGLDILLTITLLFFFSDYSARIFSLIFSSLFAAIFVFYSLNKNPYIKFQIDKKIIYKILVYSSPLILHTFFTNILNYADRYFINNFIGVSELGKYSVIYQLCMVMSLMINSFAMAWTPYFMKNMAKNESIFIPIFNKTFKYYGVALLLGGVILFLIMPFIYRFYVGEEYVVNKSIYIALLSGYFFQGLYRFKVNRLFFVEKTMLIAFLSLTSAIVNLSLNYFLIQKWGLFGAAFATLVSYIVLYIALEIVLLVMKANKSI